MNSVKTTKTESSFPINSSKKKYHDRHFKCYTTVSPQGYN